VLGSEIGRATTRRRRRGPQKPGERHCHARNSKGTLRERGLLNRKVRTRLGNKKKGGNPNFAFLPYPLTAAEKEMTWATVPGSGAGERGKTPEMHTFNPVQTRCSRGVERQSARARARRQTGGSGETKAEPRRRRPTGGSERVGDIKKVTNVRQSRACGSCLNLVRSLTVSV